ncbi:unnamed protein product [Penicillium roqueforti FM164]|uniref:Genomic scaffold, ProqFM164S01 n=1 Tax=Penicillium roqueforti (strain FM164) TaxID=1365484 RepID=W6PYT2_PENRF|nr:unnamed protein product [Penicillium roqueforti FM164]
MDGCIRTPDRIEREDRRVRSFQTAPLGMSQQRRSPPVETVERQATPFFFAFLSPDGMALNPWVSTATVGG